MSKAALAAKQGLHFDVNFRQFMVIAMMFLVLFVMPIQLYNYILAYRNNQVQETYTISALLQNNRGQVAGLSTAEIDAQRYYSIPIINFDFDTQLQNPATIYFLFGVILILTSLVVGIILLLISSRKTSA
jgi:hypothetical protein